MAKNKNKLETSDINDDNSLGGEIEDKNEVNIPEEKVKKSDVEFTNEIKEVVEETSKKEDIPEEKEKTAKDTVKKSSSKKESKKQPEESLKKKISKLNPKEYRYYMNTGKLPS